MTNMLCDDILALVGEHVLDIRLQEANRRAICDEIRQIKTDPYAFGIEELNMYDKAFNIMNGFVYGPLNFATGSRKDWGTDRELSKWWYDNDHLEWEDRPDCIYIWNFSRDDEHVYE